VRILGIDPGLATTGFGAIECGNPGPAIVKCGSIKTPAGEHISNRLSQIHTDITMLIRTLQPDLVAVENAFSLVRYPKAGIVLGGVLGIIYLSVFQNNVSMIEITPKEIKNALVGYGNADKQQVNTAIKKVLHVTSIRSMHASDALAAALAAFYRKTPGRTR
jgi:crossover junction endodeoxyribonuclease RuvC